MSYHDHANDTYGSLATPCTRCGIEFALQCDIPRLGWVGVPCKPYSRAEWFALQILWRTRYLDEGVSHDKQST